MDKNNPGYGMAVLERLEHNNELHGKALQALWDCQPKGFWQWLKCGLMGKGWDIIDPALVKAKEDALQAMKRDWRYV